MLPVLTQIAAGASDGLFFPLFPDEGAHIVRQIDQIAGLEGVTLIGGSALLVSDFLSLPESEGVYFPGPESNFTGNNNEATGKSGEELFGDYREKYGEAPTSAYLARAYAAATLLLRAIDDAAVADGDTMFIDRATIRGPSPPPAISAASLGPSPVTISATAAPDTFTYRTIAIPASPMLQTYPSSTFSFPEQGIWTHRGRAARSLPPKS